MVVRTEAKSPRGGRAAHDRHARVVAGCAADGTAVREPHGAALARQALPRVARERLDHLRGGTVMEMKVASGGVRSALLSSELTKEEAVRTMPCPLAWATSAVKAERRSMPPALQAPARYPHGRASGQTRRRPRIASCPCSAGPGSSPHTVLRALLQTEGYTVLPVCVASPTSGAPPSLVFLERRVRVDPTRTSWFHEARVYACFGRPVLVNFRWPGLAARPAQVYAQVSEFVFI